MAKGAKKTVKKAKTTNARATAPVKAAPKTRKAGT